MNHHFVKRWEERGDPEYDGARMWGILQGMISGGGNDKFQPCKKIKGGAYWCLQLGGKLYYPFVSENGYLKTIYTRDMYVANRRAKKLGHRLSK